MSDFGKTAAAAVLRKRREHSRANVPPGGKHSRQKDDLAQGSGKHAKLCLSVCALFVLAYGFYSSLPPKLPFTFDDPIQPKGGDRTHTKENVPAPGCPPDALQQARKMIDHPAAAPKGIVAAEDEGMEFWRQNQELFKCAWDQYGRRNPLLYTFDEQFEEKFIHPELVRAVAHIRSQGTNGSSDAWAKAEKLLQQQWAPVAEGVWSSSRVFSELFCQELMAELSHLSASGIPIRRPNGMNRYGAILQELGFASMLTGAIAKYIRPLAQMLLPETIATGDAAEYHAFVVRYKKGEDLSLKKHRDASVATLNLCLGSSFFEGGGLRYFPGHNHTADTAPSSPSSGVFNFSPGVAVLHSGQLQHEALPLTSGERQNLVIWLFGRHGYVRVAPYKQNERLQAQSRWLGSLKH